MTAYPFSEVAARRLRLLYHFGRLQLPSMALNEAQCAKNLERTYALANAKHEGGLELIAYFDGLHLLDWHLACGCLERRRAAWEMLFAARSGKADCLLVDALRSRAVRLYPRDAERQETAVSEFWSQLFAGEGAGLAILARYDGLRPLVPWLIRVFQNQHISILRRHERLVPLPDDDLAIPLQPHPEPRWREAFCQAAKESFEDLSEQEILVLGLRLRYRLSQREVASILDRNEGNISRQTTQLRERCLKAIGQRLQADGWAEDDMAELVQAEMAAVLLEEPRLSGDNLARLLRERGKSLPEPHPG
ncbi:MAG TPA: sigma-70 family RNA polymerase sigma factor [Gemmataceae bacterium]|nr:sigma-70 family RNA polymerase sigma factor [Gemmataceae bacterium]